MMKRSARITLHPKALQHNLQQARLAAPNAKILAVIKANAYGHGMLEVASILKNADGYAVSCLPEAVELRYSGTQHPILVLQGHQNLDELIAASSLQLRVVIHDPSQLSFFEHLTTTVHVALKIDTGMHRIGISPEDAHKLYSSLKNNQNVAPDIWVMTHFSCADDLENSNTEHQIQQFNDCTQSFSAASCIPNSAGILGWPTSHSDWIRPGIMLYGSSPFGFNNTANQKHNLQAAMTLTAPLIAVHTLKKGEPIGYGASYNCPYDMQVGVVACGYADGYPRHAETGTPVYINNTKTHLIGRVSMDMIVINLHNINAEAGDIVELWGKNISVDQVAYHAETISYELLCNAGNNCIRNEQS